MSLSFLPKKVNDALSNLNYNFISEIRLRRGQPVLVEYKGEYKYLNSRGATDGGNGLIYIEEINPIIVAATGGSIYSYNEQIKNGFITVEHGIRIGIAGEYVTSGNETKTIKNITSLNIRIPHDVVNCAEYVIKSLYSERLHSTMLYSKPGLGKTTMLRDIAKSLSGFKKYNILVFDERNEISAIDEAGNGYDLGDRVDIVRCCNKLSAIENAVRAMKPQVILTDELYGEEDMRAMRFAVDCGICVIASSHISDKTVLRRMPFEYFVELTGIGARPLIYDKNFNSFCDSRSDNLVGNISLVE